MGMQECVKKLQEEVISLRQTLDQNGIHYEAPAAYTDIYR